MIRSGLCVYSSQKRTRFANYRSRVAHFSFQDNYAFKIIKRGMPKLYEYNINQKYKKTSCIAFNDSLLKKYSASFGIQGMQYNFINNNGLYLDIMCIIPQDRGVSIPKARELIYGPIKRYDYVTDFS